MATPATMERRRFADELLAVGPDAPTLCTGWTARDLAAHVVLRDRRPDAMPGVLIKALAGYTARVQRSIAARPWADLVADVRDGAPISPTRLGPVDRFVNTAEFFVHLEDVRRAQPDWEPRELPGDLAADLYGVLQRSAKMFTRKAPAGVTLAPTDGHDTIVAHDATPMVTVSGPVGELVLWIYGRQAHARVGFVGPDDAIADLQAASFGI